MFYLLNYMIFSCLLKISILMVFSLREFPLVVLRVYCR